MLVIKLRQIINAQYYECINGAILIVEQLYEKKA